MNDSSDFAERICQRLDTRIRGAGHYEVVAKYFGFNIYDIRSSFEKSVGGPSGAMIDAIIARQPELTVEEFARVVEQKARRKDVADLLRKYDSLKGTNITAMRSCSWATVIVLIPMRKACHFPSAIINGLFQIVKEPLFFIFEGVCYNNYPDNNSFCGKQEDDYVG